MSIGTFRITGLSVSGFKSIAEKQSIKIQPLTILAGANSSGKSAMIQPLLLLKQTLEARYDPGSLLLSGSNVKFTSADQFLSHVGEPVTQRDFRVEIAVGGNARLGLTFTKAPDAPIDILELSWTDDDKKTIIRSDWTREQIQSKFNDVYSVLRDRFWLRLIKADAGDNFRSALCSSFETRVPIALLQDLFQKVLHIPGIRGNAERTYPASAFGPFFPGTFEHYVASIVARWQSDASPQYQSLNADLRRIGLTDRVIARRMNETEIDLLVSRIQEGNPDDLVSVADVGLGVSHLLPLLVAVHTAAKDQLVYVEEPEIHLHPSAQVKLAEILSNAAKRGVRVVAETHSTLFLTAVQTLVARGELKPNLVKLHWFQRDSTTGITTVSSTGLDENGAFRESGWPEDFDDVILKAESAYLDAVEGRQVR